MSDNKTAVEWLFEKLWNTDKDKLTWHSLLKKAKEIEKSQIDEAYRNGQQSKTLTDRY